MEKRYYVYILATRKDGPIYIGFTSDLAYRLYQHKTHEIKGHTAKYNIDNLVYFEGFDDPDSAIAREKKLKR
ncbi:MAG: GIY-YIG nuclease family protein, partial [Hyphomicrobiales bacterium]|nr:GIY-YIG nuclease family protein [Hyphomicrobiales bacterium]